MLKSSHHRFREVGRVSRRRNPTASPFNAFLSDYAALIRPTNATNASTSGQARGRPNAPSPLFTLRLRFLRLRFLRLRFLRQASFDKLPSTSFLRQASFDKLRTGRTGRAGKGGEKEEPLTPALSPSPFPLPPGERVLRGVRPTNDPGVVAPSPRPPTTHWSNPAFPSMDPLTEPV